MDEWMTGLAPHLRALTELVAHNGHMTAAAESLGIPQSSMSRRIHAIEDRLGVPLTVPDGRKVRPTPAAVRLAQLVDGPLREIDAALTHVAADADPEHGTVRFGFPLTMGSGEVPDLLEAFNRRNPGIRLELKQAHGAALIDDLRSGALDLAVTIPAPDGLPHTVLGVQRICAVLPDNHRFAGRRRIRLAELRDERFIANPPAYNLRQLTETWCAGAGFGPRIDVEISEFATVREFVRRGLGVALLPVGGGLPDDGAVDVPLAGDGHRREIALTSATALQSPPARLLADFIAANGL
ncbi:MAG: LysR family transcriptional regulator [Gordonia amarae]